MRRTNAETTGPLPPSRGTSADQDRLFHEVFTLLKPNGKYLVVEPVFHVTEEAFAITLATAKQAGFRVAGQPSLSLCRAVLLERAA